MNWRAIQAIIRKDLKVVLQNKGVSIPMLVIPVIILVLLPSTAVFAPLFELMPAESFSGVNVFVERMPASLQAEFAAYNRAQTIVVLVLIYFLAPMYLIMPLMVASVIAADAFAGEKERKTLEALLYTPTTDGELLLGKLLSAWLPAVAIAWGGFVLYSVVSNLAAWRTMGHIFFPTVTWIVLALWVAPAVAGLGLGATVLVSARAKGFQDAYQLGVIVVLPLMFLAIGQATGMLYFDTRLVLLLGLILWVAAATLLWFGARTFRRDRLAARMSL